MRALKVGNSGEAVKNPRKLGGEPHGGLRIEGHLARVQAGSEVVKRHVNGVLLQFLTVLDCSERMIISNKNERAVLILQINKLAHSAKVVAYVRPPGWLDAREEHLLPCCHGVIIAREKNYVKTPFEHIGVKSGVSELLGATYHSTPFVEAAQLAEMQVLSHPELLR